MTLPFHEDAPPGVSYGHRPPDTDPTPELDDLVRLAAQVCGVPLAAVSLTDGRAHWFPARPDVPQPPRATSLFAHTLLQSDLTVVPDAPADPRFQDDPLVTGTPHVRFYAGVPLKAEQGPALGSLCVLDTVPRTLTPEQQESLRRMAHLAASHLQAARRHDARCRCAEERHAQAESERQRLAAVLAQAEEAILTTTLDGVILSWNKKSEDLYSLTADEMVGRHVSALIPPALRENVRAVVAALQDGDPVEPLEILRTRRDGAEFHAALSFSAVRDPQGRRLGLSCVTRDVTAHRRIEETLARTHAALAENEERLRCFTDAAFEGIAISEGDVLTSVSPAFAALFGYDDPARMEDMTVLDLTAPGSQAQVMQKRAGRSEQPYEATMVRRDGTTFEAELRGRTILRGGRIARVTALRDITGRKAMDTALRDHAERLRRSEAGLRALLESAPVVLYAVDRAGSVTLCEGMGLTALRLKPGEAVGRSVFDGGSPENEAYTRRAQAGEAVSFDMQASEAAVFGVQAGGLWLHTELRPLWSEDGTPNGHIGVCFDVTERINAEQRFRLLFEHSSDSYLLFDEGGIIDCNPATIALLRCADKTEVLSLHPAVLSPEFQPDGRRSDEKSVEMDALARKHGLHRFEWTHRRADGEDFPVEVTLTHAVLGDRPVLLVVWHDLTERMRAEEAVRQLGRAVASVTEGVTVSDARRPDMPITYTNPAFLAMTGFAEHEVVGCNCRFLQGADTDPAAVREIRESLDAGKGCRVTLLNYKKDGTPFWNELTIAPILDAVGTLTHFVGIQHDITALKVAEASARQKEARLVDAQRIAGIGDWELEVATLRQTWSAEMYRLLEFDPAGDTPDYGAAMARCHADGKAERDRQFAQSLETGEPFQHDMRLVLPSGTPRWCHLVGRPERDGDGSVTRVVGTLIDITERMAREQQVRDANRILEVQKAQLEAANEVLETLATTDPLTGLLNHRAFQVRLAEETARVRREDCSFVVVMLDLDNFKFFNDVYGHSVGDQVLRRVAGRLREACPGNGDVARFGGDEFALLLPDVGARTASEIEEHLRRELGDIGYCPPGSLETVPITVSLGASRHACEPGEGIRSPLDAADERLRVSKTGGGVTAESERVRVTAMGSVSGFSMLDALVTSVDNKDRYTRKHSEDVMAYSLMIARELGQDEAALRTVAVAALLHDVGKIGVPDAILRKPGKLTDAEFETVRQHPMMGAIIVQAVPGLEDTLDAVRHHHERWDGDGYPFGLQGEETPPIARLMAVADAFSAMTTDRPYRKGMEHDKAMSILKEGAGTQWDPACVAAFRRAREKADTPSLPGPVRLLTTETDPSSLARRHTPPRRCA